MTRASKKAPRAAEPQAPETPASPAATCRCNALLARIAQFVPEWSRTPLCLLLVFVVGMMMYYAGHEKPPYAFWDENYHLTSAQRYIDHVGHMEPHPPLGLLLIAAGEKLSGANAGIDKGVLLTEKYIDGNKLPEGFSFAGMRLMPSLFGALGALLFFGLMRELTGSRLLGLLFSSLYLFENAWIVHFRAVHLDSFQIFFAIGVLWMFVRAWKRSEPVSWLHYFGMAALVGAATMVKINAALLLALFPILYFRDAATRAAGFDLAAQARLFALKAGGSVLALVLVIAATFSVHALVSNQPIRLDTSSGRTDAPFMSQTYRDYLDGKRGFSPAVLGAVAHDYYRFMDNDHKGVPKLDECKAGENGSHPLRWPMHYKTINYRWDSADGYTRYVQLTGNQVSWYLGLAAVLLSLLTIANRRLYKVDVGNSRDYPLIEVFTAMYLIFMLAHLYLGAQRVMYLYHYFIGLLFSYVLLVLNWQHLCEFHAVKETAKRWIAAAIALVILASCLFFLPLSNHWPLNKEQCERRNIFSRIVDCQG